VNDEANTISCSGKAGERVRGFTWEQPQHADCEHDLGPVIAVKADGKKLAVCQNCNLLKSVTVKAPAHAFKSGLES
jgi:hypothetical protein